MHSYAHISLPVLTLLRCNIYLASQKPTDSFPTALCGMASLGDERSSASIIQAGPVARHLTHSCMTSLSQNRRDMDLTDMELAG